MGSGTKEQTSEPIALVSSVPGDLLLRASVWSTVEILRRSE